MKLRLLVLSVLLCVTATAQVQTFHSSELISVKLERISPALRDVPERIPTDAELNGPRAERENESLERHPAIVNPDALPKGADPALQKNFSYKKGNGVASAPVTILSTWNGLTAP